MTLQIDNNSYKELIKNYINISGQSLIAQNVKLGQLKKRLK